MIIASIAMEELALSHIINAEGEKLQYVLGTLPGEHKTCASTREILAVNKSIKELLDTVMQSQLLLKGKLEKALETGGYAPPSMPEPPCPCGPPCSRSCCEKSAIKLVSRCDGLCWEDGSQLPWKCVEQRGCRIRWNKKSPALVSLDSQKTYALSYVINLRDPCRGGNTGDISVKLTPYNAFSGILPLYFSMKCLDCSPLTLHYSTTLFPQPCPASCADLSLLLNYRNRLFVDQASLSIFEI